MKHDSKLVLVAVAIGLLAVPALALSAGKVSYSDLSFSGSTAKDAHRETIEISSWSLGASNPAATRGNTNVNAGILTFTASTVPPSVGRLCQSHVVLRSMTVEADGQRREFRDVAFKDCPAGGTGTFTLTFNGQTTAAVGAPVPSRPDTIPNVTISGLTPMSCQNNLKQLGLATHHATIVVSTANGGVWKTTNGGAPAPGTQFPSVVIEGRGGTKVTFLKVTLKDVMISSAQPAAGGPGEVQKIDIAFESTTATPQLIDAILAGR